MIMQSNYYGKAQNKSLIKLFYEFIKVLLLTKIEGNSLEILPYLLISTTMYQNG